MSHLNQMLKWKMVKPLNERFDNMWSFQCDIPFCSSNSTKKWDHICQLFHPQRRPAQRSPLSVAGIRPASLKQVWSPVCASNQSLAIISSSYPALGAPLSPSHEESSLGTRCSHKNESIPCLTSALSLQNQLTPHYSHYHFSTPYTLLHESAHQVRHSDL